MIRKLNKFILYFLLGTLYCLIISCSASFHVKKMRYNNDNFSIGLIF